MQSQLALFLDTVFTTMQGFLMGEGQGCFCTISNVLNTCAQFGVISVVHCSR